MKRLLLTITLILLASLAGLPQTAEEKYEEISQLKTVKERKKWFARQEPEVKAAVWREQLSRKLADPNLTKEQAELIIKLREIITPELVQFNKGRSEREYLEFLPLRQAFNEAAARAAVIFSPSERKYLFEVFGSPDTLKKE